MTIKKAIDDPSRCQSFLTNKTPMSFSTRTSQGKVEWESFSSTDMKKQVQYIWFININIFYAILARFINVLMRFMFWGVCVWCLVSIPYQNHSFQISGEICHGTYWGPHAGTREGDKQDKSPGQRPGWRESEWGPGGPGLMDASTRTQVDRSSWRRPPFGKKGTSLPLYWKGVFSHFTSLNGSGFKIWGKEQRSGNQHQSQLLTNKPEAAGATRALKAPARSLSPRANSRLTGWRADTSALSTESNDSKNDPLQNIY